MRRLESVHNALEGARIAAAAIVGADAPRCETPWFWSDQYSLKLQIAGLSEGYDTTTLRGDPEQDGFSLFYHRGDRLIAVDAVNRPAEFLSVKSLLMNGLSLGAELADERRSMKELMHGAREVSSAQ